MLTLLVCVLYPSTLRTFILRASYLFYLFAAIVWGVFPKAGPLLFGFDVPATATHIVAVLFTFLGLLLIAAVQTDVYPFIIIFSLSLRWRWRWPRNAGKLFRHEERSELN